MHPLLCCQDIWFFGICTKVQSVWISGENKQHGFQVTQHLLPMQEIDHLSPLFILGQQPTKEWKGLSFRSTRKQMLLENKNALIIRSLKKYEWQLSKKLVWACLNVCSDLALGRAHACHLSIEIFMLFHTSNSSYWELLLNMCICMFPWSEPRSDGPPILLTDWDT